jgi:hypothetical protein
MKKIILILISTLFFFDSFPQELKTYSGVFKNGTAVYQYYENNDLNRIYQGKFNYTYGDSLNQS